MENSHQSPIPALDSSAESLRLINPRKKDEPLPIADVRAEFERLSRQSPHDPEAERAFIEKKIEIVRSDPHLTDGEKQRAIEELLRGLK
jgi:hypothetical protein